MSLQIDTTREPKEIIEQLTNRIVVLLEMDPMFEQFIDRATNKTVEQFELHQQLEITGNIIDAITMEEFTEEIQVKMFRRYIRNLENELG